MVKEIKLIAKTGKTKEGKAFTSFKAVQKDGKLVNCHFRQKDKDKNAITMPSGSCIMKIDSEFLSYNTSKQYPELWVQGQPEYVNTPVNSKLVDELF